MLTTNQFLSWAAKQTDRIFAMYGNDRMICLPQHMIVCIESDDINQFIIGNQIYTLMVNGMWDIEPLNTLANPGQDIEDLQSGFIDIDDIKGNPEYTRDHLLKMIDLLIKQTNQLSGELLERLTANDIISPVPRDMFF